MRISDWSSDVCSSDLSLGHEVTIAARHSAQEQSALASLPILIGDYVANDFTSEQLADFDALVFAACYNNRQRLKNYAVFGNVEYDISEQLKLKGCIRYTEATRSTVNNTFSLGARKRGV